MEECVLQMRDKIRIAANRTLETSQSLASNSTCFQCPVKSVAIPIAVEKRQVSLTYDHVIRSRIIVKLLMPLFKEVTADLLDMVTVHDVEDFISNPLTFTPAADRRQHQARERAATRLASVN